MSVCDESKHTRREKHTRTPDTPSPAEPPRSPHLPVPSRARRHKSTKDSRGRHIELTVVVLILSRK